jgi:hypothetical protein
MLEEGLLIWGRDGESRRQMGRPVGGECGCNGFHFNIQKEREGSLLGAA